VRRVALYAIGAATAIVLLWLVSWLLAVTVAGCAALGAGVAYRDFSRHAFSERIVNRCLIALSFVIAEVVLLWGVHSLRSSIVYGAIIFVAGVVGLALSRGFGPPLYKRR
jgi:hypothetical protein